MTDRAQHEHGFEKALKNLVQKFLKAGASEEELEDSMERFLGDPDNPEEDEEKESSTSGDFNYGPYVF